MPPLESAAPHIFALGQFATSGEVAAAACADLSSSSTIPIEDGAYTFMQAVNGWVFAVDPTGGRLFTGCAR
jgi:hypothetical protein